MGLIALDKPASKFRWLRFFFVFLSVLLLVVGPWPADNSPYAGAEYYERTVANLLAPDLATGQLRAGFAAVDITPPIGHQLAGFSGRKPFDSQSVFSRLYARALTLSVNDVSVTILAVDLLLINKDLSEAVLKASGLESGDVFFTATHTHGGPGEWGDHLLERLVIGDYDPEYAAELAELFAEAVTLSRNDLTPVELSILTVDAPGIQYNRMDGERPTFDQLSALLFRPPGKAEEPPLVSLVSFGAHATATNHNSHAITADYPGALVDRLMEETGAKAAMFAAGSVGDASPYRNSARTIEHVAVNVGERLADLLIEPVAGARYQSEVTLGNGYLPVELPEVRVPITSSLRFSPLSTSWIGPESSHLHVLRVGGAVLVGFPADYSGQLAFRLQDVLRDTGMTFIPTSFNGDYLGYMVTEDDFFDGRKYETRILNFYGPWLGPYYNDLSSRLVGAMVDEN